MRAGSGANMALLDAWELAQQLLSNRHNNTQAAIAEFAAQGAGRSSAAINGSHRAIRMAHSAGLDKAALCRRLHNYGKPAGRESGLHDLDDMEQILAKMAVTVTQEPHKSMLDHQ